MVYLIYQSWHNTSSNHAGMKYMCQRLEELYPQKYKAIEFSSIKETQRTKIIERSLNFILRPLKLYLKKKKLQNFAHSLDLKKSDVVILTEYMDTNVGHLHIAKSIKEVNNNIQIFGISHLVPDKLDSMFDNNRLCEWTGYIDGLITFGHSLTNYYIERGIKKNVVHTTFHYVDDYYLNSDIGESDTFKILVQGNQMRDMETLSMVVKNNPEIKFIVCQGVVSLHSKLDFPNVKLIPFISETELRRLMQNCPVSLNIMHDTIGSNVIVTSMGMGQAMICSDVGSIRDYCDDSNCIFCKSVDEFSKAISELSVNEFLLKKMRYQSSTKARRFNIYNFEKFFYNLISSQLSTLN